MSGSEIARLRREIELQCEAAIRGLDGYAGVARHEVISHKIDVIGQYQKELEKFVGAHEAMRIVMETYINEINSSGVPRRDNPL
jgi:hypothetical protein